MKVFLDMVGCRLNQSELESFARQFRQAGHSLVSDPGSADLVLINTCTVTSPADSDSRQKIHQAFRRGATQIIATGCYATLNPQLVTGLPGVKWVIPNLEKENLVSTVLNIPSSILDRTTIPREPIPGSRLRTRAFIKVQDGCDNHCTYCITRLARGPGKSRSIDEILLDIHSALRGGCQEIVLTGVHLGSWGYDFSQPSHLYDLIWSILDRSATPRLHLSSIEPWDIGSEFFDLWQDKRLCRHLHLPLQSGCAATLKRMGRKVTPEAYASLINQAKQSIPGISITTDIITGFPGETEDEFTESMAFIEKMNFSGGHVFTFSPRPGTVASNLPDPINPLIARQRNSQIRQIFHQNTCAFQQQHIGQTLAVLWEKAEVVSDGLWELSGLSQNNLRVHADANPACLNQITDVHITGLEQDRLLGEIIPKRSQVRPN